MATFSSSLTNLPNLLNMENNQLYFCGDIHGNLSAIRNWNNIVKNSTIIQIGDFQIQEDVLKYFSYALNKKNNKLIAFRGNHDKKEMFNDQIIGNCIELLSDYSVCTINDKKILMIGGGLSLDRYYRKQIHQKFPHKENWYRPDEEIIYDPSQINRISSEGNIDIFLTHVPPPNWIPLLNDSFPKSFYADDPQLEIDLKKENLTCNQIFNHISSNNNLKLAVAGHHHCSLSSTINETLIKILNINEIYQCRL